MEANKSADQKSSGKFLITWNRRALFYFSSFYFIFSDAIPPVDENKLWDKGTARSVLGLPSNNRSKWMKKLVTQSYVSSRRVKFTSERTSTFSSKKYCQENWVLICEVFDGFLSCSDNIYLMDEFYNSTDRKLPLMLLEVKFWAVAESTNFWALFHPFFFGSIEAIYLRKLCRSAPLISKLFAKISRLVDQEGTEAND